MAAYRPVGAEPCDDGPVRGPHELGREETGVARARQGAEVRPVDEGLADPGHEGTQGGLHPASRSEKDLSMYRVADVVLVWALY